MLLKLGKGCLMSESMEIRRQWQGYKCFFLFILRINQDDDNQQSAIPMLQSKKQSISGSIYFPVSSSHIIKLMIERPRFVFEQEEYDDAAAPQRTTAKPRQPSDSKQQQETKATAKGKQGNTGRNSRTSLKKNEKNREGKQQVQAPKSQIQEQITGNTTNQSVILKYSQVENHSNAPWSNPSSILNKKTESSVIFEDKMITHFQDAKTIRPNTLFREESQSPVPQDDRRFFMPPPQPQVPQFDPYKYAGYNKQSKLNKKDYQSFLDTNPKNKKTSSKGQEELSLESKIIDSSLAELQIPSSEIIQSQILPVDVPNDIDAALALALPAPNSVPSYSFTIQKKLGVNYFSPDFKIWSKDEHLIVSAKKQSFHLNSHYNIYAGESSDQKRLGYLRGNFGGTEFNIYQCLEGGDEVIGTVIYKSQFSCNAYRKMEVYVRNSEVQSRELYKGDESLKQLYLKGGKAEIKKMVTKDPDWRQDLKCYVMSFKGHGRMSSTKNTILLDQESKEDKLLFCKRSTNRYYLQIGRPLNLLATMGVLLTSFDFKLLCQ